MKKRAMALALSVAMVLGSVPLSVSAEEPEVSVEVVEAEAEAKEAQAGEAEATGEPAEEAEEAEEIIAEPQIAVESLEEVPEATAVEAEELAPANDAVATADAVTLTDKSQINGVQIKQSGKEDVLGTLTGAESATGTALDLSPNLKITYDPTRTSAAKVLESLGVKLCNKSGVELTAGTAYSLSLEGNYTNVTKAAANAAYLCISFMNNGAVLGKAYVKYGIEQRQFTEDTGTGGIEIKYDSANPDIVGAENDVLSFVYNGKERKYPISAVNDVVVSGDSKQTVALTEAKEAQTSGSYYTLSYSSDITNASAAAKTVTIKGTGNYSEAGAGITKQYKILPKQYTSGDISVPKEEKTFRIKGNDADPAIESTLKAEVKDALGNTTLKAGSFNLVYYALDENGNEIKKNEAGKDLTLAEKEKVPSTPGKYHYYVHLTNGSEYNFKITDAEAGTDKAELMGSFVVKPEATTLEEMCETLDTTYSYTGEQQDLAAKVKADFETQYLTYKDQITVKCDKETKDIVNAGSYYVTITPTGTLAQNSKKKVIEVKITALPIAKENGEFEADFAATAVQGMNYDKTYAKNEVAVTLTWKGSTLDSTKYYTVATSKTDSADSDKITEVEITGKGNYTGTKKVAVTNQTVVDLSKLGENAEVTLTNGEVKEASAIKIYDKTGTQIPAVTDSGIHEYEIVSDGNHECSYNDNGCNGKHTKAGEHSVWIKAGVSGRCMNELEVKFTVKGEKNFEDEYEYNDANVVSPVYGTPTSTAPHQTVMIRPKAGGNFLNKATMCTFKYVCLDDPETDAAKRKASGSDMEVKTSEYANKVTFPRAGKWKLIIKPTGALEDGKFDGELEVPFTVEPKKFAAAAGIKTYKYMPTEPYPEINDTDNKLEVEWRGGDAVSVDDLEALIVVKDGTEELTYKTDYTATAANNEKAGTATVKLQGQNNYSGDTIEVKVTIKKRSLVDAKIDVDKDYQGEGYQISKGDLKITFEKDFEGYVPESDYDVTDQVIMSGNGYGVGAKVKVTVKATAEGNYEGSRDVIFDVEKADIGKETIFELRTADQKDAYFLEDGKVEPVVELYNKRTEKVVYTNADSAASGFEVSYTDQDKVGTATVTVKAADTNEFYTGTAVLKYTIATAKAGAVELKNKGVFTYTGKALDAKTDVIAAVCGKDGKETTDYEAVWEGDNKNAGSAVLVVTGDGFETRVGVTIKPASIVGAEIGNLTTTYEYTGDVVRPEVTVTVNGTKLVRNVDYQLMNTEETGLGEKGLAVHGINNYTGDILEHFTVVPASLKGAKVVVKNAVYNGKVRKPAVTVSIDGKRLKAADYTVTYDNTAKIGAKTATIEGKGNYTGTVTAAYKVTPAKAVISKVTAGTKKLTVAVKAQAGAKYQIFYRQKGTKKWSVVLSAKASKAITVKSGVKYQVRVRAYAVMNGAKSFGTLSTVKTSAKVK